MWKAEKYKYEVCELQDNVIVGENLNQLSDEFVKEQIKKAEERLNSRDYDGAITTSRTLVERVLEGYCVITGNDISDNKGNLLKLYKEVKEVLNLDPSQKDLSDTLKQILSGLNSVLVGLSGLSNRMGDRHSRKYKPAKHHAKLAINVANTFCQFIVESHEYQQNLGKKNQN